MKQRGSRLLSTVLALVMLFTCVVPALAEGATAPFTYEGTEVNFIKEDGSPFGMFAPQEGTTAVIEGDNVVIHYVPKNTSIYGWLHWGAIGDAELTKDVTFNDDGTFDITLSKNNCGKAIPVCPLKKADDTATTSTQYYLAIPSADKLAGEGPVAETFGFTLQVGQYTEGEDFHTASFEGVTYALTDQTGKVWEPSNATSGMLTYRGLPGDGTYTFTASKEGWAVVTQGEWDVTAHAYIYTFTGADEISVVLTAADADKNITDATNPGMILREKPREANAVEKALALVPADLSIFTDTTAAAVTAAVTAADPEAEDAAQLEAMAQAVTAAVQGLVPKDGVYFAAFEHIGRTMFKIIDVIRLDVRNGQMTLHFVSGTQSFTKLYIGTTDEANAAAESQHIPAGEETTSSTGKDGYKWEVPVSALQTEIPIAAYSKSKEIFNSNGNFMIPAASLELTGEPEPTPERVDLTIINNTGMFKAVSAYVETAGSESRLVAALSGTTYHYLYKGTYTQALANGDNRDNWLTYRQNADGKYEFVIPLEEGETYIPLVSISNSYLTKYEAGQNPLERAFYPRQFELDLAAKTLTVGDYDETFTAAVTSALNTFRVADSTSMRVVGGPNSNNFQVSFTLQMEDDAYDQVTYPTVVSGKVSEATAALSAGSGFAVSLQNAPAVTAFADKEPIPMQFRVKATGRIIERLVTVNLRDKSVYVDGEELPPVLGAVSNEAGGVKITWNAAPGAAQYRVFVKGGSYGTAKWVGLGNTTDTSYVHKDAVSGTRYTYTVRCVTGDGKSYTSTYDTIGKTITFVAAPKLNNPTSETNGVKVTWGKVAGAAQYRVFVKGGSYGTAKWVGLGNTSGTSYVHTAAVSGTSYTYTVRCISADGKSFTSDFDAAGKTIKYTKPSSGNLATPKLNNPTSETTGVKITWGKVTGAAQYRVFVKGGSYGTAKWVGLSNTAGTSYVHKDAKSGTQYTYTVRCVSADGKSFTSDFDAAGKTIKYTKPGASGNLATPKLNNPTSEASGVKITWGKVTGAAQYRVFVKGGSYGTAKWVGLGNTAGTSYVHKDAKSGTQYTYTVRCVSADGKSFTSDFDAAGKTIKYAKPGASGNLTTPKLNNPTSETTGVKITWGKVTGAAQYRVFVKGGSYGTAKWVGLGNTTGTSYVHKDAKSGTQYTYTVRCVSADGKSFTSDFDAAGKTITFLAAPKLNNPTNETTGVKVTWGKVTGAAQYRVFVKGGSYGTAKWVGLGNTAGTSYIHKDAKSGTQYTYTVRCVSADGKSFASGFDAAGKTISYQK